MITVLSWALCAFVGMGAAHAGEISSGARGHAFNPVWSPDGRYLAFEINDYERTNDLYMVEIASGSAVAAPQKVVLPGARSSFSGGGSVAMGPVWHPKGALIFEGSASGGSSRLYLVMPGRQAAGELLTGSQIGGDLSWPTVSPDGSAVMFVSDVTGGGDLYSWDQASNTVSQITSSPFAEMAPKFSEDGSQVVFTRKNRGGHDVYIMANGAVRPRIGGNGDQSRPAWHASDVIFYSNERGEQEWDIMVSAGVGKKRSVVKNVRLPHRMSPSITPDGGYPDQGWVVYGVSDPTKSGKLYCESLFDDRIYEIETGLVAAGEAAMAFVGGRWMLAFTALPARGADWRQLHVIDISSYFQ
jgi:Tol biopolymer transport system component